MRKLTVTTLAVTAVISAGAGAAAASVGGPAKSPAPSPTKSSSVDRISVDRNSLDRRSTGTARDRSGTPDTSLRLDRSSDRTNGVKADR